ncbi:asparagine synthase [Yimella lutea]|uniref:Asparagine synthase n=1 Tax=Yimella lutea TaxID=587872 RepID=A0A542EGV6_9MICO|nr:asparagine synthase-related protein [Yimella lutea]TQJ14466.1 asparagine synthase [Yimella lutea]
MPGLIRDTLARAVDDLCHDRQPTAVLSGGIDSSSVAALAVRCGAQLTTVSMGTELGDEFDQARLVADHLGTNHRELRTSSTDILALPK